MQTTATLNLGDAAPARSAPAKSAATTPIAWKLPQWSKLRELRKVRAEVFATRSILRVTAASLLIGAGLCLACKLALPQLQLGFLWRMLLAMPVVYLQVAAWFAMHYCIRAQLRIDGRRILYSNGQSCWACPLSEVQRVRLLVCSPEHLRLHVLAGGRTRRWALPPSADLDRLEKRLGPIEVYDKRTSFARLRRSPDA